MPDYETQQRMFFILHDMATERTGWRRWLYGRWYYNHEALRNDAATLIRDASFHCPRPFNTRILGSAPDA